VIPVPSFVPKQTLSTAGGIHVSNPETDPPAPFVPDPPRFLETGPYSISVNIQGNRVVTDLSTGIVTIW